MLPQILVDAYRNLLRRGRIGRGDDKVSSGWPPALGYLVARDEKGVGVDGGDAVFAAWRTRDLGSVLTPTVNGSVVGNRLSLNAGRWLVWGSAPAYRVNQHQTRVYNIDDSVAEFQGTAESAPGAPDQPITRSMFCGIVEPVVSPTRYEVQHRFGLTQLVNGMGKASGWDDEVYTIVHALMLAHG